MVWEKFKNIPIYYYYISISHEYVLERNESLKRTLQCCGSGWIHLISLDPDLYKGLRIQVLSVFAVTVKKIILTKKIEEIFKLSLKFK